MSAANKDRVYVALYARGGQDPNTYHWAIIVGPKEEVEGGKGYRYHVKQQLDPNNPTQFNWVYQALDISLIQTSMLLGRVMIAKVTNSAQLRNTLDAVRDAVTALEADGMSLGTRITNWAIIEQSAKDYIGEKRQQRRYDGSGPFPPGTVPTFDLIERKEIVP
ncbi:hypothetical protein FQN57_007267 [Myotisia sp. PD_48]|nr:hypothetical protein FQN57_007267 [Myotisia sp. PD_48]